MPGHPAFNPDKDIPSLKGKVILITGGYTSVVALAKHDPEHIYFTGRNTSAANDLISLIKSTNPNTSLTFLHMDFSSLASVKAGTKKFAHDRLDILMCNAGIMQKPPSLSKDGYEIQFAINHLAHAMLTRELLPILIKTSELPDSDVRIVSLSSMGWRSHPRGGVVFDELKTTQEGFMGSFIRYGQSKLANIVYASELSKRYPSITSVSIHPSVVTTTLVNDLSAARRALVYVGCYVQGVAVVKPEEGVLSQLWVAAGAHKNDLVNGAFYMPVGILSNNLLDKVAKSEAFGEKLWDWTAKALDEC
ncbi:hypothetical protein G7Y89_g12993 [Cudoniella acicularis]|uniref:Oxidoreductase n=1 Tax=Cudoniella acicularis TaxID=354080 RepID=A0A8H4RBJ9_9HELO|nr:hypothetical protein G7Y89_g12993 [Cudoniella acicularis]